MILAILQARMSSSRLPGKVLKPVLGVPMLLRQIERISRSRLIDKLCVATTSDATDNPVSKLCEENSIPCFRGSMDDVLDRYYQAAKKHGAEHIVRLTGDCPLTDPAVIDDVIRFYVDGNYDFVSNCICPTFPDGLDVAVFSRAVLEESWREAMLPSHREHVTSYARQAEGRYKIGSYEASCDRSHLRWTVDEKDDYDFVVRVYEELYPENPAFTSEDVVSLLSEKKDIASINSRFIRNEGLLKSLAEDQEWLKRNSNETE
ncbi:MAG: glycosyltransferase family protein [Mariprofundaceae bacterium]|nr:glycosyltransferase family protein [Mariprofundaceae bacterium]